MNKKLWKTLYIIGILALVAGFLFIAANQKSFWEDEAFTAIFAQKDTADLFKGLSWDVHPPLYLFLASQWGRQFGFTEIGLRSFSILWILVGLLLTYKLTLDLLGEQPALIAFTLTALNPLILMYGHNARYYSLTLVLALLVAWGAFRFKHPRQAGFLTVYVLGGAAFMYILFAGAAVLLAANLWWLVRWFCQKKDRSLVSLALWVLAQLAVIGLYLPALGIVQTVSGRFSQFIQVDNWLTQIATRAGYYAFVSAVGETLSPLNPLAWVGMILVVTLATVALLKNWRNIDFWLVVVFFGIIAGTNLLLTFNQAVSQTWQNLTYRAVYVYPFLMIWLAAGINRLRLSWAIASAAALGLVFIVAGFNYLTNRQFIRPVYTVPWKEVFGNIQVQSKPGALVVCGFGDSSCYYYAQRFGYGSNDLNNWGNLSRQEYPEVWYIQTNLGRGETDGSQSGLQETFLAEMARRYSISSDINFAPQDPSIRWLKSKLINQEDYEYRLILRRFFQP